MHQSEDGIDLDVRFGPILLQKSYLSCHFAVSSPERNYQNFKNGSGVHGAIVLITRATPRVAAKIEILLHIK